MLTLSSTSSLAMNGVMAALIAARMVSESIWVGGVGVLGLVGGREALGVDGMSSLLVMVSVGVGFLMQGVGEGSSLAGVEGPGVISLPLGVMTGDGHLAACGRCILVAVGMLGPGVGVEPDTVRFFPTEGGLWCFVVAFGGQVEA